MTFTKDFSSRFTNARPRYTSEAIHGRDLLRDTTFTKDFSSRFTNTRPRYTREGIHGRDLLRDMTFTKDFSSRFTNARSRYTREGIRGRAFVDMGGKAEVKVVPERRFELPPPFEDRLLRPACLPIPPSGH